MTEKIRDEKWFMDYLQAVDRRVQTGTFYRNYPSVYPLTPEYTIAESTGGIGHRLNIPNVHFSFVEDDEMQALSMHTATQIKWSLDSMTQGYAGRRRRRFKS